MAKVVAMSTFVITHIHQQMHTILWRVAKCLSYIGEARCLKVKWNSASSLCPKKATQVRSDFKSMLMAFFDSWGVIFMMNFSRQNS